MGNETSNMTASPVLLCRLARQGDAVALSTALARLTPAAKRAYLETHDDESTPLEIATTRGHVECVRELVHAGADVNRRYRHSQTVLHLAVHTGNRAIVWLLVHTVGVERNAVDANGDTPLLLAAHDGQPEAMEALLTSTGVDIFARNTQTDKDVFTATRTACATAPTAEKPRFKKCIATMEKVASDWDRLYVVGCDTDRYAVDAWDSPWMVVRVHGGRGARLRTVAMEEEVPIAAQELAWASSSLSRLSYLTDTT